MNIKEKFSKPRILVVGDVMLDRYWWGSVNRISPEAPVPVVRLDRTTMAPGGAANVAANIAGLGARSYLVGCVGRDNEAALLKQQLELLGVSTDHLTSLDHCSTSVKTRVIAHSQQVVRVDQEFEGGMDRGEELQISQSIAPLVESADIVLISDYAKGVLTEHVLATVFSAASKVGIPVLVDPKGKSYSRYLGASMLTPNRREAAEACNLEEDIPDLVNIAGNRLLNELQLDALLITQGEHGMTLFEKENGAFSFSANAREIYDVTGAGDTVLACLGVALASGFSRVDAARLANIAASLVVEQVGTTAITADRLEDGLRNAQGADTISTSTFAV